MTLQDCFTQIRNMTTSLSEKEREEFLKIAESQGGFFSDTASNTETETVKPDEPERQDF